MYTTYLIIGIILITFLGYFIIKKVDRILIKKIRKFEYKVGEISNNIGEIYFKIVARSNEENEYLELLDIPFFYKCEKLRFSIPIQKFDKKEKAEKELKKFLVETGKLKIKTTLKV